MEGVAKKAADALQALADSPTGLRDAACLSAPYNPRICQSRARHVMARLRATWVQHKGRAGSVRFGEPEASATEPPSAAAVWQTPPRPVPRKRRQWRGVPRDGCGVGPGLHA